MEAALNANRDRFSLEHALPSWTHRGMAVFPEGRFHGRVLHSCCLVLSCIVSWCRGSLLSDEAVCHAMRSGVLEEGCVRSPSKGFLED